MKTRNLVPILLAGIVAGGLVGYLTRPAVPGGLMDLAVLFDGNPSHAPFRAALAAHLGNYLSAGAAISGIAVALLAGFSNRATQA